MAEKDKRLIALGKGSSGGGGDAVWGSIGGTITDQTDLMTQLNKKANTSSLSTVATSGNYNDLTNKPTIPTATSDLQNDSGFITLADIPAQIQSNWNESDTTSPAYIIGKPSIPAAQVNSDWNASSGVAEILNKPDLTSYATKTEVNTKDAAQDAEIATKIGGVFMTQAEFESITPVENVNYFVENTTVEMVVTFTDQTTATYNVVVE